MPQPIEQQGPDVLIRIKVVPGASRNQPAGVLGDRIKIRISAPPEAGKANKAVCELLATSLKIKAKQVTIESGHISPEKLVRIASANANEVRRALT